MMDTGSSSDDTGILAELKALHRTWCMDGSNDETSAADAGSDQQLEDNKETQKTPLTSLEKARKAISKLPASSAGDGSIVPYLFSALDKTNTSPTLPTPEPTDKKKISTHEYELRQMEWHVVLILELWSCASQSGRKSDVLDALSSAILLYRDQQSRQKSRNVDKKKKKKKRKRDKQESKKSILSQHEKQRLVFDHLVNLLSRAPFLLPRDVPLSQFLNNNILSSNRLFWERLPKVVSHIYESFEIPNPYLKKKEKSPTVKKDASKKKDNEDVAAKKRKSEKLQAMAKSKKRQRLALLTTKRPKYQGSHFSANQNGISKLLDTKKTSLSSNKRKSAIAKTDKKTFSATERKSSNLTNTKNRQRLEKADATVQKKTNKNKHHTNIRDENKVNSEKARNSQPKRTKPSGGLQQKNNIDALLADPMARAPHNKSAQNDSTRRNNVRKSSNTDALLMTPRKTVRSDTASQIIGETPKGRQTVVGETPVRKHRAFQTTPKGTDRLVVGETPVPSHRSKVVVGETPTYETTFGSTPTTSESPFFSPPVLPSPSKLPLEERKMPCKQPFKLFGLLKRTNSVGMNAPKGLPKKTLKRTSSIDNARAFLRQKSL